MKLKKAFVIGGGPLGISICSELLENNYKVVLIEASSQLLGLASTFKVQDVDVEEYYHFFYKNDHHNSLKWLEKFSKENPPIYWENISTDSINSSGRYNLDSPFSIIKLCRLKTFKVLITLLKLIFFKPNDKLDKISAEKWAIDNFGLEFSKKIWIPLLKHKFGNNSNKVSALWLATRIKRQIFSERR